MQHMMMVVLFVLSTSVYRAPHTANISVLNRR